MNELTFGGWINDALKRRYGISGVQSPAGVLASEIFPVLNIGDDALPPELHFLASSRLAAASHQVDTATNIQTIGLQNPAGSGIVAVILEATAFPVNISSGEPEIDYRVSDTLTAVPDATFTGFSLDGRFPFAGVPVCTGFEIDAGAVIGGRVWREVVRPSLALQTYLRFPVVVTPGRQFNINAQTGQGLSASFIWRERRLTDWER